MQSDRLWLNRELAARLLSGKTPNKRRPIPEVPRSVRAALCIFMSILLVGCSTSGTTPVSATSPVAQTPLPAVVSTEPVPTPAVTAAAIGPESQIASDAGGLLQRAVANLQNATSFQMAAHVVRAYRAIDPSGATRIVVYGEFNADYAVIRLPTLKVHAKYEDRYDPQADFLEHESYTVQENGKHFTRFVEATGAVHVEEIDHQRIQPRYCQMLWIGTPSAASIQGMGMNDASGSGSHCSISASPFGNSTPALTRATR